MFVTPINFLYFLHYNSLSPFPFINILVLVLLSSYYYHYLCFYYFPSFVFLTLYPVFHFIKFLHFIKQRISTRLYANKYSYYNSKAPWLAISTSAKSPLVFVSSIRGARFSPTIDRWTVSLPKWKATTTMREARGGVQGSIKRKAQSVINYNFVSARRSASTSGKWLL